jgi:hypothetical protein
MNDLTPRLAALGDALYQATRANLERSPSPARNRRRLLIGLGAAAALIPAAAIAASAMLSSDEVARSLPAGTLALVGTRPTCEVVVDQVEYHCALDRPPRAVAGPGHVPAYRLFIGRDGRRYLSIGPWPSAETEDWLGAAEPTVDSKHHVNGGCRALDADGMTWRCYIGEAAVKQGIISRQFLGARVRGPGVG